MFTKLLKTPIL